MPSEQTSAYNRLMAYARETCALGQVAGRLGWDQETMMPRGAGEQRAEEMAAMEGVLHARRVSPQLQELIAAAEAEVKSDDRIAQAQLRELKRASARALKVPAELAQKLARLTSQAQGIWADARAKDDVAAFLPTLAEVVELRREEAACLAGEGGDLYDALVDEYEPGTDASALAEMFATMRPRLVALREGALNSGRQPADIDGIFGRDAQLRLSQDIAARFGYDFTRGRIDLAVHPFSSGSGQDVRITTRVAESDPFNCLYSTIHEVGHACYEQGIDHDYLLTPLGAGASMGVHESQSRIYENQLGRSRAFTGWLFGQMRDRFGDFGIRDEDAFYASVNKLQAGMIRTEADEVQYNLHIMLRFDLERALIHGDLAVSDLEAAWNERFKADFGLTVERPSQGMLQDVHWSLGLFGYFPTYSLGNLYAGMLHQAMRADLPDLDGQLSQGLLSGATGWLRERLQRHGSLMQPVELIREACGQEPSAEPLLSYLETKFSEIYGL